MYHSCRCLSFQVEGERRAAAEFLYLATSGIPHFLWGQDGMDRISEKNRYSLLLAIMDFLPVLLFGISWIRIIQRGGGLLAAIGMAMIFFGGLSKAIWKMYVVQTGKEYGTLQKLFRILMPAGGTLALVAAIRWCCSAPWHLIISRSVWILLAGFVLGMFLMGIWGRTLDDSRKSTWIKELTNLIAQSFLLWFVMVY